MTENYSIVYWWLNKELLYSKRNSTQYSVKTYMEKKDLEEISEWI